MREAFFEYQAQTTPHPLGMQVAKADGSYIYDTDGKKYLDFVAGVSACSLGHKHPAVVKAIKEQLDRYLHVMVYGEYAQEAPVMLAKELAALLPESLNCTYFANSGTEAIDGAIKLARRFTGRSQIIAAKHAYHGNTMGAMSLMGYEERKAPFRPLLPDIDFITFNQIEDLKQITSKTAAVVLETIQGGAGFILPEQGYLKAVKQRCQEVGALLVLDEIQPGMGRTGSWFGFDHYQCTPDILVTGKGLGGGMPIGAFTASKAMMATLANNPILGHITTFGGHPVIAAAALATLRTIRDSDLIDQTLHKEALFREHLKHPLITEIRGKGLMLALMVKTGDLATKIILECQAKGLILFWLLFEPRAIRITPPLTISEGEIIEGCQVIMSALNNIQK